MSDIHKITYNLPQLVASQAFQPEINLEWGRGTGKTTYSGRHLTDLVVQMPRSSGIIVGETYQQILTRTLPSTIAGLEQHGLIKDLHFFVGKRPPAGWDWPEPYQPPLKYDYCITFWNGACAHFVSQDRPGSGRGLNADWVIGDEAAILDKNKLDTDVLASNRGNLNQIAHYPDGTWKYFKEIPRHHSILFMSSTPLTAKGRWFIEREQSAIMNPKKVFFSKANGYYNLENLGHEWFDTMRDMMPDFIYDAEILNKRIKRIEDGFYPELDEAKHQYTTIHDEEETKGIYVRSTSEDSSTDLDCHPDLPLHLGVDWGAGINCLPVGQFFELEQVFKFINSMFVTYPKILDDLALAFCAYYRTHSNKRVFLWYDNSGNTKQANSKKTYAEQFKDILKRKGWAVAIAYLIQYVRGM